MNGLVVLYIYIYIFIRVFYISRELELDPDPAQSQLACLLTCFRYDISSPRALWSGLVLFCFVCAGCLARERKGGWGGGSGVREERGEERGGEKEKEKKKEKEKEKEKEKGKGKEKEKEKGTNETRE